MKRLVLCSLALCCGCLLSTKAHAAMSAQCQSVLSLPPVSSHYVAQVVLRARNGLSYARAAAQNPDFSLYLPDWTLSIGSAFAALLDSDLRFTAVQEDLLRHTACLHFDLLTIECLMEEVRQELRAQLNRGSFLAIMRLESLLQFLNERLRHLRIGALDPAYPDPTWGLRYAFDPPSTVWCCPESIPGNACTQVTDQECSSNGGTAFASLDQCLSWGCTTPATIPTTEETLCPYDSDYAPAFQNGYGCDVETMTPLASFPPLQEEREALRIIQQQIDEFRSAAETYFSIEEDMDELYGRSEVTREVAAPRVHRNAFGCSWSGGTCSGDRSKRCTSTRECAAANKGTCDTPTKVCSGNTGRRCTEDSECALAGPCIDAETSFPAAVELRGPFSLEKDQLRILQEFMEVRVLEENARDFPQDLQTLNEIPEEKILERRMREIGEYNPLERGIRASLRLLYRSWSRIHGRREAAIFPIAVDTQREIEEVLTPLHDAVSRFSQLASRKDGVRAFVNRFAYFLRRSCIYRPCSLALDQIIKISTTDACFPYTDGAFLTDTVENPRWQQCKEAAGIP